MHVFQNLILLWGRIPTPEWEEAAGCEKTSHLQNHRSTNSHSHRQRQSWEYSFWISLLLRPLSIIKVTHKQLWNWHLQWIWHGAVTTMVRCNGKTQLYDAIVRCNCMMQLCNGQSCEMSNILHRQKFEFQILPQKCVIRDWYVFATKHVNPGKFKSLLDWFATFVIQFDIFHIIWVEWKCALVEITPLKYRI